MANTLSNGMGRILASSGPPGLFDHEANLTYGMSYLRRAAYVAFAHATLTGAAGPGHLVPFFRLPADTILAGIYLNHTGLAGVTNADLGCYRSGDWTQADQPAAVTGSDTTFLQGYDLSVITAGGNGILIPVMPRPMWSSVESPATPPRPGTTYDLTWRFNTDCTVPVATPLLMGLLYGMWG